jgi:hypothetical protein
MKQWILGLILAIGIIWMGYAAPAYAAGGKTAVSQPFTGVFEGTVYGDFGSSAPLTLELTQRGTVVEGTAVIGTGLKVNAGGFCGTAVVPASSVAAEGTTSRRQPRHLSANIPFEVSGLDITARITGDLAADGEELDVAVKVDTPFVCGRDPVISGVLLKGQ